MSPEEFVELHCAPELLAKVAVIKQISLSSINPDFRQELFQELLTIRKNIEAELYVIRRQLTNPTGVTPLEGYREIKFPRDTLFRYFSPDEQRLMIRLTVAEKEAEKLWEETKFPMVLALTSYVWMLEVSQIVLGRQYRLWGELQRKLESVELAKPEGDSEAKEAPQYVSLDQIAAICGRAKRTAERWKTENKLPPPDNEGGGGRMDEWIWSTVRPTLETISGRKLPERYPATVVR